MIFSEQDQSDVSNPTPEYIAERLRAISPRGPGFFALTSNDGSYVQTAGARLKLIVEYRLQQHDTFQHFVLGDADVSDVSVRQINSAAGPINLLANEVLDVNDAIEVFQSFAETERVPERFLLRDQTWLFVAPEDDEPPDAR